VEPVTFEGPVVEPALPLLDPTVPEVEPSGPEAVLPPVEPAPEAEAPPEVAPTGPPPQMQSA
jgi:hypothetical protein